ncbi:hypothetical protein [Fusibacter ferrireducens]|uniref:Uncharacterized protein n=1 Tax=Fusibacter ferrireducens TaxID=2785058 RepID=A0ABR9ZUF8_9FIRM|nr:hypothetical protein [Fusibacter ferrireducens]MBF4694073.1 hypothetical protein [Fusibacter ferrireducens]
MAQMLLYARFEPKAVLRNVHPQTASAKIVLRHRKMAQMLIYAYFFMGISYEMEEKKFVENDSIL